MTTVLIIFITVWYKRKKEKKALKEKPLLEPLLLNSKPHERDHQKCHKYFSTQNN